MYKALKIGEIGAFTFAIASAIPGLWGQEVTAAGPVFRSEVDLHSLAVRVTDRKENEIHGLTADRFSLYEDGVRKKISFFASEEEPVSLGILLDVSNSMASSGKLDQAKEALTRLVRTIRPADEMFYLQFHRQVDKIVDLTSDPQRILEAITRTGQTTNVGIVIDHPFRNHQQYRRSSALRQYRGLAFCAGTGSPGAVWLCRRDRVGRRNRIPVPLLNPAPHAPTRRPCQNRPGALPRGIAAPPRPPAKRVDMAWPIVAGLYPLRRDPH
jgi:hypothetical protein